MSARNVSLFTLLIDGSTDDDTLRTMMYSFYVNPATLAVIRAQSASLACLSESLSTWKKSPYSRYIRIVNTETIEILNQFWTVYSGNDYSAPSFRAGYTNMIKSIYRDMEIGASDYHLSTETHQMFWAGAAGDDSGGNSKSCNPLFVYSRPGGMGFAVDISSNPQAGFHLVTSVAKLSPQYELDPRKHSHDRTAHNDMSAFILQFGASCASFKRLVNSNPRRLRIRVFAGDAIAFCMALKQHREPGYIANCYTRPGSVKPLVLDGENHSPRSGNRTPTKFNVIETGYLMDRIGLLNLLPHVIDALQCPASVLYTSTRVEKVAHETNLMENLLCGDVSVLGALLGVVPSAYICGHTFQASEEYHDLRPFAERQLTNRIVWVPTTSADPKVDLRCTNVRCNAAELAGFLFNVYNNIFSYESEPTAPANRWYQYTRRTFAGLLEVLKPKVHVNWIECAAWLLSNRLGDINHVGNNYYTFEIFCQLAVSGVAHIPHDAPGDEEPTTFQKPVVVMVTVPRRKLQPIFVKLSAHSLPISFQIYIESSVDRKSVV